MNNSPHLINLVNTLIMQFSSLDMN